MKGKINEDLQNERRKCSFNVEELTNYLDNGVANKNYRRALEDKVFSIKGLIDEVPEEYLSHKEKYENSIRKAVLYYKNLKKFEDLKTNDENKLKLVMRNMITSSVFKDVNPFLLHVGMFVTTIKGLADDKQKEYWLKRAENLEFIGTYAQTELGHGTFIRGLETTATYDPDTEEFVLNSPTLSSYKWWPGGLGHTANYCIVMAQLYSKGQHCGIQPFLVQIRDEDTHMPLPGIKVGEIGAKQGFNCANNGFLGFDNVRIPRDRMLMKNAQVLKVCCVKGLSPENCFSRPLSADPNYYEAIAGHHIKPNGHYNLLSEKIRLRNSKIMDALRRNNFYGKKQWQKFFPPLFPAKKHLTSNNNADLVLRTNAESNHRVAFSKTKHKKNPKIPLNPSHFLRFVSSVDKPDNTDSMNSRVKNETNVDLHKFVDTQNNIMKKMELILTKHLNILRNDDDDFNNLEEKVNVDENNVETVTADVLNADDSSSERSLNKVVIDETEIRKRLKVHPLLKRLFIMAKKKRDEFINSNIFKNV